MRISASSTIVNPKLLQRIAFAAVIMFALLMSYMIHITHKTVASVMVNQEVSIEAALSGTTSTSAETTTDGN